MFIGFCGNEIIEKDCFSGVGKRKTKARLKRVEVNMWERTEAGNYFNKFGLDEREKLGTIRGRLYG